MKLLEYQAPFALNALRMVLPHTPALRPIQEYGTCATADEFFEFHPQLGQKKILRLFYSPDLFMAPHAKYEFVEPDLTGFPKPRQARPPQK